MTVLIAVLVAVAILVPLFWLVARITRGSGKDTMPNANDGFFGSTPRRGEDRPFD